jgi:hypothetical protein
MSIIILFSDSEYKKMEKMQGILSDVTFKICDFIPSENTKKTNCYLETLTGVEGLCTYCGTIHKRDFKI